MRLMFLGPPGAGKGTQAALVAEKLGIAHIATGDILRRAVDAGTPLGLEAKQVMERGDLVPDGVVNKILKETISETNASAGYVLDGYPRTAEQAAYLEQGLGEAGRIDAVVLLKVPGDEIVRRLSGRRICSACETVYHVGSSPPKVPEICDRDGAHLIQRVDDSEGAVRHRLAVFQRETQPLIELYEAQNIVIRIDGTGGRNEVFARIVAALDQLS